LSKLIKLYFRVLIVTIRKYFGLYNFINFLLNKANYTYNIIRS